MIMIQYGGKDNSVDTNVWYTVIDNITNIIGNIMYQYILIIVQTAHSPPHLSGTLEGSFGAD